MSTKARTTGSSAVGRGSTLPKGMSSCRLDVLTSNAFRRALTRTLRSFMAEMLPPKVTSGKPASMP
jgi:hypothetical protein